MNLALTSITIVRVKFSSGKEKACLKLVSTLVGGFAHCTVILTTKHFLRVIVGSEHFNGNNQVVGSFPLDDWGALNS